jgi:hypothetical protein
VGSTWDVFRRAATPSDPTFGTVISLGNINAVLSSVYGAGWMDRTDLYLGAAGNNGSTSSLASSTSNLDYARTVYATKLRTGAGEYGLENSDPLTDLPVSSSQQAAIVSKIAEIGTNISTIITNVAPGGPAFGHYQGGITGSPSSVSTYTYGSIDDVVLGLDLYRQTPVINSDGWQNIENVSGVEARKGHYLGTITLSGNGDLKFAAVPEPSTYALLVFSGVATIWFLKRRRSGNI